MEIYENLSIESLHNEEWRDVVGWEGLYQVSNLGRVKSLSRSIVYKDGREYKYPSKIIKNQKVSTGYRSVTLYRVNGKKQYSVHRLVAETFIPNPNKYLEVNHKDENKHNNCVSNLEWCTSLYNNTYNNVHLKRKHYVHRYEYELNEIKKLEDKLKNLKASFIKKYPSINIEEIKSKH